MKQMTEEAKMCLKAKVGNLLCTLLTAMWISNATNSWLPQSFTFPASLSLFVEQDTAQHLFLLAPLPPGEGIIYWHYSKNLLNCCVVPPTDILAAEVPPWAPGLVNVRMLLYVHRESHLPIFLVPWSVSDPPITKPPVPALLLILAIKLLVGSSSIPKQSSMHSNWSLT